MTGVRRPQADAGVLEGVRPLVHKDPKGTSRLVGRQKKKDRQQSKSVRFEKLTVVLLVPPTGVISNSFLEDLERIWSLRDVIPNPKKI
jgi:hypothetical protein